MKKVAFVAAALVLASGSALAQVKIKGNNEQTVTIKNGGVANVAGGMGAEARTNIASNKGKVDIGGNSKQAVSIENGGVANVSGGARTKATMNLGSNDGTSN
jgi:metal-dependent HD superfamily phosphatase/phosphodiesterase